MDEQNGVLHLKPAQLGGKRRARVDLEGQEPAWFPFDVLILAEGKLLFPAQAQIAHAGVDGAGLGAHGAKALPPRGGVEHFQENRREACLLKDRLGRPALDGHLAGVQADKEKHPGIEQLLKLPRIEGLCRRAQSFCALRRERRAQELERLEDSLDVGGKRLTFHIHRWREPFFSGRDGDAEKK